LLLLHLFGNRAERDEIAWSKRALRRLFSDEQKLLEFLCDKAAGRTNATLTHHSKRHIFKLLLKAGVSEDEVLQLLADYRRLPYAEDEDKGESPVADASGQTAEVKADETGSQGCGDRCRSTPERTLKPRRSLRREFGPGKYGLRPPATPDCRESTFLDEPD